MIGMVTILSVSRARPPRAAGRACRFDVQAEFANGLPENLHCLPLGVASRVLANLIETVLDRDSILGDCRPGLFGTVQAAAGIREQSQVVSIFNRVRAHSRVPESAAGFAE
jgi:hypothetical protein